MESRYRLFGHSIHMMVVPFAVGLLGSAAVFDGIALVGGKPAMAEVAFWLLSGGLVVGMLAAPFGFLDWMDRPDGSRAESLGRLHGRQRRRVASRRGQLDDEARRSSRSGSDGDRTFILGGRIDAAHCLDGR